MSPIMELIIQDVSERWRNKLSINFSVIEQISAYLDLSNVYSVLKIAKIKNMCVIVGFGTS